MGRWQGVVAYARRMPVATSGAANGAVTQWRL
jgi:hypothetical protein